MSKKRRNSDSDKKHHHNLLSKFGHALFGHDVEEKETKKEKTEVKKDVEKVTKGKDKTVLETKEEIDAEIQKLIARIGQLQEKREEIDPKPKKSNKKHKSKVKVKSKSKDMHKEKKVSKKKDNKIESKDKIVRKDSDLDIKKKMKDKLDKVDKVDKTQSKQKATHEDIDAGKSILQILRDERSKKKHVETNEVQKPKIGEPTQIVKKDPPADVSSALSKTMPANNISTHKQFTHKDSIERPFDFQSKLQPEGYVHLPYQDKLNDLDPSTVQVDPNTRSSERSDYLEKYRVGNDKSSSSDSLKVPGVGLTRSHSSNEITGTQITHTSEFAAELASRRNSLKAKKEIKHNNTIEHNSLHRQLSKVFESKKEIIRDSDEDTSSESDEKEWKLPKADKVNVNPVYYTPGKDGSAPPPLPRDAEKDATKSSTSSMMPPMDNKPNSDILEVPIIKVTSTSDDVQIKNALADLPPPVAVKAPSVPKDDGDEVKKDVAPVKEDGTNVTVVKSDQASVDSPKSNVASGDMQLQLEMMRMKLELQKLELEKKKIDVQEKKIALDQQLAAREEQKMKLIKSLFGSDSDLAAVIDGGHATDLSGLDDGTVSGMD